MIDQLEESAELLARSERESAWREMAKQVAHEIKNPLTPMKLSVQYLKRAWDDKADDWDNRLDRFTNTLIEQIDSLSTIASAFSDFAKMPKSEYSDVDIAHSVKSAVDIFEDTSHNVSINLDHYPENYFIVKTDAKQIVRVYNNLLKNAIQAIPDDRMGVIDIKIYQENNNVITTIKDNGKGIPTEMWEQIFTPNFTTKSSGMGLGLAIVKNIVVNSGGEIYFSTELNIGTTFYVKFPLQVD
jgi:nitrogen fixation/metabolism regulation signal transduction histidine kinase